MLSTTGLIKKNLEINKKLPLKWQGFKGNLYYRASGNEVGSTIPNPMEVDPSRYCFHPINMDITDLLNSKLEITIKANLIKPTGSDMCVAQCGLTNGAIPSTTSSLAQISWSKSNFYMNGSSTSSPVKISGSYAWVRFMHDPNTKKDTMFYSTDGKTFITQGTAATLSYSDLKLIYFRINPDNYASILDDFSSVTFKVNDQLVFGKDS